MYYILDGHTPVAVDDVLTWGRWFEDSDRRRVALATWRDASGEQIAKVSTVFLGLDHAFGGGPLEIFETMIFWRERPTLDEWCDRCATWEQAEAQHEAACALVRAALGEAA